MLIMNMRNKLVWFLAAIALVSAAYAQQISRSEVNWNSRRTELHDLARQNNTKELHARLKVWKADISTAPCEAKVSWLLMAYHYELPGEQSGSLISEMKASQSCAAQDDRYSLLTTIGTTYYEAGMYDSAFHSLTKSFEVAAESADTNQMVMSLSNLAALYSEMDWKVEALSTALRAYSLAYNAKGISELTDLFLQNNVASLQMDLGYYDRAAKVFQDYDVNDQKLEQGHIYVLRAVNYSRLMLYQAKGDARMIRKVLSDLESSPSAFMIASSFAVADSLCPPSVLDYIHDTYVQKQNEFVQDTGTFVSFGIPALGGLALRRRIDESLRFLASSLRPWASSLPLGSDRLGYKLAMAQMFEIPDYWEDYWRESESIEQRDVRYAGLQNKILDDFNKQVELETSALEELEAQRVLVRVLVAVAIFLLGLALALLFWVNSRYKKALMSHKQLLAENDRMSRDLLVQATYYEELGDLIRKAGKSVKTDVLEDVLFRMNRDRPTQQIELSEASLKQYDLTATEAKVLIKLAYGYRNAEIAQMLNISKSYIHNVRSKLRYKLPLEGDQEIEDFAVSLRKVYEPTK
jgi:DNA-binding CsgD family transcriptional regulator